MQKYKVALFIGRFQPFHNGHLYSLKKCFELAEKVIVGIGSSNESRTENNPWNYNERVVMIESLEVDKKLLKIVGIEDFPSDSDWVVKVKEIIASIGYEKEQVLVVSNNDWVTKLMEKEGYDIYESGLVNRDELEGVKIRSLMRSGDESWKSRVPKEVLGQINMSAI